MIDLTSIGRVTSEFGYRSSDSTKGVGSTNHKGIDIVLKNDNIPAVTGGTVSASGWSDSMGYYVFINQSDGTTAKYMHMANPPKVGVGQSISEGQIIGIQGSTGNSTGKHLHYQVQDSNGNAINPRTYMSGGYAPTITDSSSGGSSSAEPNLIGKIVSFVTVLAIFLLGVYIFFRAFDIKII